MLIVFATADNYPILDQNLASYRPQITVNGSRCSDRRLRLTQVPARGIAREGSAERIFSLSLVH